MVNGSADRKTQLTTLMQGWASSATGRLKTAAQQQLPKLTS
jgi:hypothetical protein